MQGTHFKNGVMVEKHAIIANPGVLLGVLAHRRLKNLKILAWAEAASAHEVADAQNPTKKNPTAMRAIIIIRSR